MLKLIRNKCETVYILAECDGPEIIMNSDSVLDLCTLDPLGTSIRENHKWLSRLP